VYELGGLLRALQAGRADEGGSIIPSAGDAGPRVKNDKEYSTGWFPLCVQLTGQ